ncbi:cytochrome oxidase assembly protein ShyY1 [Clavibacter sp. B3I6]|uniref:SURF1 family cytochrome oxidase biogenesis protein n=1 Tax=Clavibacter sp. B3I6 TaxID=3042268 RepID=UPI0027839F47|nr:SURF1 family protein [Clavibacter sp. B3I6]MDQ0742948.1 cytochrome oxidase assembly protein ShyY1 [Clavibacter sp. B3I6]
MTRWRFVLNRRWAGYLLVAVVFAIACVLLSHWQFARRDEALAEIAKVEDNWDSAPLPVDQVLADTSSYVDTQKWTPVSMTGTYLVDEQLLARNRPFNGQPGFEVLTPLRLEDGRVFVVDRGWVPIGNSQDSPDSVPAPPEGQVTVTARLKAGEPELPGRSAPAGQIATVHLPDIAGRVDAPTYTGAYGLLISESPAPAEAAPFATPRPAEDEGPHLSYAFQWIVFAIIGFAGLGIAVRNEYRIINADDPEEQERERARQAKRARKRPSDADVEDRILDDAR